MIEKTKREIRSWNDYPKINEMSHYFTVAHSPFAIVCFGNSLAHATARSTVERRTQCGCRRFYRISTNVKCIWWEVNWKLLKSEVNVTKQIFSCSFQ